MSAVAQIPTARFEFTFMEYLAKRDVPALPTRVVRGGSANGQKFFDIVTYH
jgi:hypothetical protein